MKIKFIAIQNFRKLKCSQINFSDKETLFVGTNNSGKTSAMDALINFLSPNKKNKQILIRDLLRIINFTQQILRFLIGMILITL
jgi:predicted ATP-dependent endonuclease of OLD family